ncbi:MAG: hypothetical protein R3E79_18805 [Caldilineaceae bacterium]
MKQWLWITLILVGMVFGGRYLWGVHQQKQRLSMLDDYLTQITQDPRDMNTLINLCALYSEIGELDKGLGYCNQALLVTPNTADALQNRAAIYYQQGKLEEALIDYKIELQLAEQYSWQTIRTFRYDAIQEAIAQIEGELVGRKASGA